MTHRRNRNTAVHRLAVTRERDHPDELAIHIRDEGRVAALALKGRLDEATVGGFKDAAGSLRSVGVTFLVIDLHEVEVVDSTGMLAVLEAEADSREKHWDLVVVPPPARVQAEFSSPEIRRLLCVLSPGDAGWLLDLYASRLA